MRNASSSPAVSATARARSSTNHQRHRHPVRLRRCLVPATGRRYRSDRDPLVRSGAASGDAGADVRQANAMRDARSPARATTVAMRLRAQRPTRRSSRQVSATTARPASHQASATQERRCPGRRDRGPRRLPLDERAPPGCPAGPRRPPAPATGCRGRRHRGAPRATAREGHRERAVGGHTLPGTTRAAWRACPGRSPAACGTAAASAQTPDLAAQQPADVGSAQGATDDRPTSDALPCPRSSIVRGCAR